MTVLGNFSQDFDALKEAGHNAHLAVEQAKKDNTEYHNRIGHLSSNPELALLQLFFALSASSHNDTALGYFTNRLGIHSDQLVVLAKVGAANNDIEGMTNSNSQNPDDLTKVANDYSQLKGLLSGNSNNPFYDKNFDPSQGGVAIDGETETTLHEQLAQLRALFDVSGANVPGDNPDLGALFSNQSGGTAMSSFYQYQQDLQAQGNIDQSTTAAKDITDHSQTITETTQTANAVLNNDAKQDTAMIQALEQFGASLAQMMNTVKKSSIQHMASGA